MNPSPSEDLIETSMVRLVWSDWYGQTNYLLLNRIRELIKLGLCKLLQICKSSALESVDTSSPMKPFSSCKTDTAGLSKEDCDYLLALAKLMMEKLPEGVLLLRTCSATFLPAER